MEAKRKIYITIRKEKDHQIIGWFIVDKKSPVDLQFDTKRHALDYVQKNYDDVTVMVQNQRARFQYTIELKEKKIVSYKSKEKEDTREERTMNEDLEAIFKYEQTRMISLGKKYKDFVVVRRSLNGKNYSLHVIKKFDGYDEMAIDENKLIIADIMSGQTDEDAHSTYRTKAIALSKVHLEFGNIDHWILGFHGIKKPICGIGTDKAENDVKSDLFLIKNNNVMSEQDKNYFRIRKAQYYGYEFPVINRTLKWGIVFAFVSLAISIFAFMINAGVGVSKNYYATEITANRWEFLVPAFLLLIWPLWIIVRTTLVFNLVRRIQGGFIRKPKYTHKYILNRLTILGFANLFMIFIVAFISVGWLIAFIANSSNLLSELSIISIFVVAKIIFIIIPKSILLIISIKEAIAAYKWSKEDDFLESTVLLSYLFFQKQTSTSRSIVSKYDFFEGITPNKVLTKFYNYKERGTTIDYLNEVVKSRLSQKELKDVKVMVKEYKESLADEAAVYARIIDENGGVIWN